VKIKLELILKDATVASSVDYQRHLSEGLRKPKMSSARVVGVPNDIQVGHIPYKNRKL
jgi:hypothetical protein